MSLPLPAFFRLIAFERLASTSDTAKRLAEEGAPEGTLVTAATQTAGRGRLGRTWVSPPGNLYLSLILRPLCAVGAAAQMGFAGSLAVAEAIDAAVPSGARVTLKWPNDVLIGGAKAAGLLLESRARNEGWVDWLVLGIGVNVASAPEGMAYPATSLAAARAEVTRDQFLPILAGRLFGWYELWRRDGFAPVRAAWLARAHRLGETIRVRTGAREEEGRFAGLDAEGRLLLEGAAPIAAADVLA